MSTSTAPYSSDHGRDEENHGGASQKKSLAKTPNKVVRSNESGTAEVLERKWELGLKLEEGRMSPVKWVPDRLARVLHEEFLRATFAEFLGSLLFLFNVITIARLVGDKALSADSPSSTLTIAFGFGITIFILVYVFVSISGANLNPAVSIALVLGKRITVEKFVLYVIAQITGGMAGAGIATIFLDGTSGGYNEVASSATVESAFTGEVICSFMLVLTVLGATDGELNRKQASASPLLPLAIGMAVFTAHLVLIPVDGCSINPARSFATSVTNNSWEDHWVFWIGPLLGGIIAIIVWEAILRPKQLVGQPQDVEEGEMVERDGEVMEAQEY